MGSVVYLLNAMLFDPRVSGMVLEMGPVIWLSSLSSALSRIPYHHKIYFSRPKIVFCVVACVTGSDTIQWYKQPARPSYIPKMFIHLAYLIAVRFTFMENLCRNVRGQVHLWIPSLNLFPDGLRYHSLIKLEIIHSYIASPDQSVPR